MEVKDKVRIMRQVANEFGLNDYLDIDDEELERFVKTQEILDKSNGKVGQ